MKLYLEPITMTFRHGTPHYLEWRGQCYTVLKLMDRWTAEGSWWHEPYRRLYLLLETDRGIIEVFRAGTGTEPGVAVGWAVGWKLSRIYD